MRLHLEGLLKTAAQQCGLPDIAPIVPQLLHGPDRAWWTVVAYSTAFSGMFSCHLYQLALPLVPIVTVRAQGGAHPVHRSASRGMSPSANLFCRNIPTTLLYDEFGEARTIEAIGSTAIVHCPDCDLVEGEDQRLHPDGSTPCAHTYLSGNGR